jgi:hypothetical protein
VPDVLERLAPAGALVCLGAVAMDVAGAPIDAASGRGLRQLLIVGGPTAVGLYALREPVNKSFGVALLGIGFAWSLTAAGRVDERAVLHSGRGSDVGCGRAS